jgi:hypothetical protein
LVTPELRRELPALVQKLEGAGVEYLLKKELLEKARVEEMENIPDTSSAVTEGSG